uniref:Transient receptor potential cation channel trpm n=1 Tax=Lygus hesperus TaxID=30085 RepID=A0A0A9XTT3_LYGHE
MMFVIFLSCLFCSLSQTQLHFVFLIHLSFLFSLGKVEKVGLLKSIFLGGEEYRRTYKTKEGAITWRCKVSRCSAKIYTDSEFNITNERSYFTHSHASEENEIGKLSSPRTVSMDFCRPQHELPNESHLDKAKSSDINNMNANMDSSGVVGDSSLLTAATDFISTSIFGSVGALIAIIEAKPALGDDD